MSSNVMVRENLSTGTAVCLKKTGVNWIDWEGDAILIWFIYSRIIFWTPPQNDTFPSSVTTDRIVPIETLPLFLRPRVPPGIHYGCGAGSSNLHDLRGFQRGAGKVKPGHYISMGINSIRGGRWGQCVILGGLKKNIETVYIHWQQIAK